MIFPLIQSTPTVLLSLTPFTEVFLTVCLLQLTEWSFSSIEGPWMVLIKLSRHCRILSVPLEGSHLIPKEYLLLIESMQSIFH